MTGLLLALAVTAGPDDDRKAEAMRPVFVKEAEGYTFTVADDPKRPIKLRPEPVYEWSNPTTTGYMHGAVFLWTRDGRPAVFGCIFSQPHDAPKGRALVHEMHALHPDRLAVTRPAGSLNEWTPKAGLGRKPIPDAPAPAATPAGRLVQLRRLAQEFAAHTVNNDVGRSELRLLPAPLYRYPEGKDGVLDGALFAFVDTSGTDPEVLMLIEARGGGQPGWDVAFGRFTDRSAHARHKGKEVWALVRDEANGFGHDPLHTYAARAEKVIGPDGRLLARIKVTPQVPWGQAIPTRE